jgi:hypothetical protein
VARTYDKKAPFKEMETFTIQPWNPMNAALVSGPDQDLILEATSIELEDRGYSKVPANGDLLVDIYVVLDSRQAITTITDYYTTGFWSSYYYGPWAIGYNPSLASYKVTKGTLIISLFYSETKNLVWQGLASGTVSEDQQVREQNIPEVIERMFHRYPVKKRK